MEKLDISVNGRIHSINIAETGAAEMRSVDQVKAVPGRGLEGDRYFNRTGTYSKKDSPSREMTLIEKEAIDALMRDLDIEIEPRLTRRNVVTEGVALNHLVGREFSVGEIRVRGLKLCEPCGHLEELSKPGVKDALIHRGGLRVQILTEGDLKVGDSITVS